MFLLCGAALSALAVHAQKKVIIEDESPKGVVLVTIDKAGDEIMYAPRQSTTSAASSTTSTLSPPTSPTGAKSETSFKWMPARPPFS